VLRGLPVNQQHAGAQLAMVKSFETFGHYLFLKRIATGGLAEVFLARPANQVGNGRIQVVKRILPHLATNSRFLNMFQSEIQLILGFNHPQIVQLHGFGEIDNQPYLSREYVEGKNLKDIILKFIEHEKQIPVAMALSLTSQGALGLHYAHNYVSKATGQSMNTVHQGISPHNLILSYDGNLKVIDFGMAKAARSIQDSNRKGSKFEKMIYLSPEQLAGGALDARSDVFALGMVAWELLTLRRPFQIEGNHDLKSLDKIMACDTHIVPPSTYNVQIPRDVDEIILKSLKLDPNERFTDASDFQLALKQAMKKHYPKYTDADTGKLVRSLFSHEIESEKKEVTDLNCSAQRIISSHYDGETAIGEKIQPAPVVPVGKEAKVFSLIQKFILNSIQKLSRSGN
jgi:eukaryotic-like serine/threonine-protein kinase